MRVMSSRVGLGRPAEAMIVVALVIVSGAIVVFYSKASPIPATETSSSQQNPGPILISLGQTPRILGPGITMNYTMTLFARSGVTGNASLSSDAPQSISTAFHPQAITFTGKDLAVDFSVHASDSIAPGDYKVGLRVVWAAGSTNLTFHFAVIKHLVLLLAGSNGPGGFAPMQLSVNHGEPVTWLNLDSGGDEFAGYRSVKVVELSTASPTLALFSMWSYTFASAGTYHIDDALNPIPTSQGIIVVK
jgi:plastocyanin